MTPIEAILLSLCAVGVVVAVWGQRFTTRQAERWEQMRQEVRAALEVDHESTRSSIIMCERHSTVSMDYCAPCRVEKFVALTRPGHVVHSD